MPIERRELSDAERLDWLRLARTENVGPITFRQLIDRYDTAGKALEALPELSRRGGRKKALTPFPKAKAERERAETARMGGRLIASCEPDYPPTLRAIDDPPPVLSVIGAPHLLTRPALAVVGARNASTNGRRLAHDLARGVGRAGYLVVSGLARGIDTAAHEGALDTGTVACVAGGLDVVFPKENEDLQARIGEVGCVVGECALGTNPTARHFPRRNRIISGMALAVLVVEAALRSGSLITARMALEQGREVLAVPGSPLDPRSHGANDLIRQGATLVQSTEEILDLLGDLSPDRLQEPQLDLFSGGFRAEKPEERGDDTAARARAAVLERLSPSPTPVDELLRDCQFSAAIVLGALIELELAGRVERQAGGLICLVGGPPGADRTGSEDAVQEE